jgi:hypothetical protein
VNFTFERDPEAEKPAAAGPGRQGAGGCGCSERPSSYSGITLSDEGGQGARADPPIGAGFWLLPTSLPSALIRVIRAAGMEHWPCQRKLDLARISWARVTGSGDVGGELGFQGKLVVRQRVCYL